MRLFKKDELKEGDEQTKAKASKRPEEQHKRCFSPYG